MMDSVTSTEYDEAATKAIVQRHNKVVKKKKTKKSKTTSTIQFVTIPSQYAISQTINEQENDDYDDDHDSYDHHEAVDNSYSNYVGICNMKRGGKAIRPTSCNKGPKATKDKLVRLHDESKQAIKDQNVKENRINQKTNIELRLVKNHIKRFGHDIYERRTAVKPTSQYHRPQYNPTSAEQGVVAAVDPPSVKKHELKKNNVPKEHGFLARVVDLQHRELTPEDYELLLLLDNTVASKTVNPQLLKSIKEISPELARIVGELCTICMESFQADEKAKMLSCKHFFHSHCIDEWLLHSSQKCPLDGLIVFPV